MAEMVVVFGGTGFLGKRVTRHCLDRSFVVRVASRDSRDGYRTQDFEVEHTFVDVNDDRSVGAAVINAFAVVNTVSLYVEHGEATFHSVHVAAAARVAAHANRAGVKRLLHISGIGADASSDSAYIRSRGQGEAAVLTMFPSATIIRPAVMFASDDSFLIPLTKTLRTFPVFPLFGRGQTKLQPAYAEDVAEAAVRTLTRPERGGTVYELGGRDVLTYEELLRRVAKALALKRVLVPIPFGIWKMLVTAAKVVPGFPITKSQVELMAIDNVADPKLPGFEVLGITPRGITQEIESLSV